MGYPEINNNIDQPVLSTDTNSHPFNTPSMAHKSFNEMFGLTQSKDQVSFLPTDDELMSQLSGQTHTTFANPANDKFSNQTNGQNTDQAPIKNTDQAPKQTSDQAKHVSDQSAHQSSDATQFSDRPARRMPESVPNHIKIGALEYGLDKNGEPTSITSLRGDFFYKGSDGKWVQHMPPDRERTVENLVVDADGNMEFDVVSNGHKVHHERNADGSHSVDSKEEYGGKLVYDKEGKLIEAPSGGQNPRKFHYDKNGQLDEIEGNLGKWKREVKDGKTTWVNTTTKARWEGEMSINPKTNDLEFRGRNGVAWNFTTKGKDVPVYSR